MAASTIPSRTIYINKTSESNWIFGSKFASRLHLAVYFHLGELVKNLITEDGPDVIDSVGTTPLSWAAAKGYGAIVKLLCANGADVNAKDGNGLTPMHYATENGQATIVKLLLDVNAVDANMGDISGHTPLMLAIGIPHIIIAYILLTSQKTDVNLKDKNGLAAFQLAIGERKNLLSCSKRELMSA